MVNICVCGGCSNSSLSGQRVHRFPAPKNPAFRAWVRFVRLKRQDFTSSRVSANSVICSAHFRQEDYNQSDLNEHMMGFRSKDKIRLKSAAIPSVHIRGTERSQQDPPAVTTMAAASSLSGASCRPAVRKLEVARMLDSYEGNLCVKEENAQRPEMTEPPSPEPTQTNQSFTSSLSSSAVPLTLYAATSLEFQPNGSRSVKCAADFLEQLQRGKDVQQMLVTKEDPDEWCTSLHHPDPVPHIKEEKEELLTSPIGGKNSSPFTLVTVKSEDNEEEHMSVHIYQNKTELGKDENPSTHRSTKQFNVKTSFGGSDQVKNPDLISHIKLLKDRKGADFAKTEVIIGDNTNYEDWQIPLSDYGPESQDNGGFKKNELPESGENGDVGSNANKQSFTFPNCTTKHSEKRSSSCVDKNKCPKTKPVVDSLTGVHTEEKPFDHYVCDNAFNEETFPNNDTKLHTEEASFDCDVCGKTFSGKGSLNRHTRIHSGEKHFSCGICCKRFIENTYLKKHMKVHTGEKPYSCVFCGRTFRQKGHINRHMTIHKGDKAFVCDVCGKTFNVKTNLNVHMRTHTGEKHFGCDTCGKMFSIKGNLTTHMRIHTGEKHFGCDICGKSFMLRGNLKTHMRIHSGEKHFGCDACRKTFTSKGNLDAHIKIHTGEKQFSCDVCSKRFMLKTDVRKHMKVHTGEKPFSCGLCEKTFSQKIHLKKHMVTHKQEKPLVVMFVVKHST